MKQFSQMDSRPRRYHYDVAKQKGKRRIAKRGVLCLKAVFGSCSRKAAKVLARKRLSIAMTTGQGDLSRPRFPIPRSTSHAVGPSPCPGEKRSARDNAL